MAENRIGENVFVSLGYITVKYGQIVGRRVTEVAGAKDVIEYQVQWFGSGDRKTECEWFHHRNIHATAEAAFK